MAEEKKLRIIAQRDLTPDENLWLDLRAELIRQTPLRVSETTTRLVTLTTALAGGAIGVLRDDVSTGWGRIAATTFFFSALLVAVVGSMPQTASVPNYPVEPVRRAIQKIYRFKETCAHASLVLLAFGMLAALLGLIFKQ